MVWNIAPASRTVNLMLPSPVEMLWTLSSLLVIVLSLVGLVGTMRAHEVPKAP
jgi:hypothetical protein